MRAHHVVVRACVCVRARARVRVCARLSPYTVGSFANEKLQAQFISALVASQRAEYEAEGIDGGKLVFPDNSEQLRLLEGRVGVLSLLDEECTVPNGADTAYVEKLHARFDGAAECYFKPTRRYRGRTSSASGQGDEHELQFGVVHFADAVMYTAAGWLEKNRGTMPLAIEGIVRDSENLMLQGLFSDVRTKLAAASMGTASGEALSEGLGGGDVPTPPRLLHSAEGAAASSCGSTGSEVSPAAGQGSTRASAAADDTAQGRATARTVLGTFRHSLKQLFATLDSSSARYVRCLKPNGAREPVRFDGRYVERQLGYNGVLAIVEIQAAGYAVSLPKREFVARYRCCCELSADEARTLTALFANPAADADSACRVLMAVAQRKLVDGGTRSAQAPWLESGGACLGITKVFLKEYVLRQLEKARAQTAGASATMVQRVALAYLARSALRVLLRLRPLAVQVRQAAAATDVASAATGSRHALAQLTTAIGAEQLAAVDVVPCVQELVDDVLESVEALVKARERAAEAVEAKARHAAEAEAARCAAEQAAALEAEEARRREERRLAEERSAREKVEREAKAKADAETKAEEARSALENTEAARRAAARAAARAEAEQMANTAEATKVAAKAASGRAACNQYRVDTNASRFGDCICGKAKIEHSQAAMRAAYPAVGLAPLDKPPDLRHPKSGGGRAARLAAQRARINDKLGGNMFACDEYRVDATAARFGDCKCVLPRPLAVVNPHHIHAPRPMAQSTAHRGLRLKRRHC